MAAVEPKDILLRVGGRTLARHGVLAVAGSRRGLVEVPLTFSRSTVGAYVDSGGVGRKAAADKLRVEWVDLDGVRETPGILLEGARTQLVTAPENFGSWTPGNTPILTAGQADPFGGTAAYLIEDDDVGVAERVLLSVGFTGDATKAFGVFTREGTSDDLVFGIRDETAAVWRHLVGATWTGGVPTLATIAGAGTRFTPEQWAGDWWRVAANATGVIAANANELRLGPTGNTAADVGSTYFFGANAWNAIFPSSYQGPSGGASPSAADSLTLPVNFGTMALTVYGELSAVWPVTFSPATEQGVFALGQASAGATDEAFFLDWVGTSLRLFHGSNAGNVSSTVDPATLTYPIQYAAQLYADGAVQLHLKGANETSISGTKSAARAFVSPIFKDSKLYVGTRAGGTLPGHYVHLDQRVQRGVFSLAECEAVP